MNTPHVHDTVSQWIDGTLAADEAAEIGAHLDSCAECSDLAEDLRRLRDASRALGPIAPPPGLQRQIAQGLQRAGQVRSAARPSDRRPWLRRAAAAIVIVGLPVLVGLYLTRPQQAPPEAGVHPLDAVTSELDLALTHYERAIAELELVTTSAGDSLDADVVAAVRASLDTLDRAIADSRSALRAEPANEAARLSLLDALRQKVDVLQATARLLDHERRLEISHHLVPTGSPT